MDTDHLIIGGGAAGCFAALTAASHGGRCLIIEKNEHIGRKLRITGKGRCNLTNNCDAYTLISKIPRNGKFLYSAFSRCSPQDVMEYFEGLGVPLKTERGNRVFPVSDNAADICQALKNALRKADVQIVRGKVKKLLLQNGRCTGAVTSDGKIYNAKNVLLATGGVSYPVTGSTGDGYELAKAAGHTIILPTPSLVPLVVKENWCSVACGLTLKNVRLRIFEKKKCRFDEQGEVMLMKYGISGPLTLSASAVLKNPSEVQYTGTIDMKPALSEQQLDARLLREFESAKGGILGNVMRKLMPGQLIAPVCELCSIPPDMRIGSVTREHRTLLIKALKAMPLTITDTRPIDEAIITRGGISVKEIDAKTMESKITPGLFFAGEIIDADGYTGGFNLQIAFSTAYSAGLSMAQAADIY